MIYKVKKISFHVLFNSNRLSPMHNHIFLAICVFHGDDGVTSISYICVKNMVLVLAHSFKLLKIKNSLPGLES